MSLVCRIVKVLVMACSWFIDVQMGYQRSYDGGGTIQSRRSIFSRAGMAVARDEGGSGHARVRAQSYIL